MTRHHVHAACQTPGCTYSWWGDIHPGQYLTITHHPDGLHHAAYLTRYETLPPHRHTAHRHAAPRRPRPPQPHTDTRPYGTPQEFGRMPESSRARARRAVSDWLSDVGYQMGQTVSDPFFWALLIIAACLGLTAFVFADVQQCAQGSPSLLVTCEGGSRAGIG